MVSKFEMYRSFLENLMGNFSNAFNEKVESYGKGFESSTLFFEPNVTKVSVNPFSGINVEIDESNDKKRLDFILDNLEDFTVGFGYSGVDKTDDAMFFKFSNEDVDSVNYDYRNLKLKRTSKGFELVTCNESHSPIDFKDLNIHNFNVRDHLGIQLSPYHDGIKVTFVFMVKL